MEDLKVNAHNDKNGYKNSVQIIREREWEEKLHEDNVRILKEEFGCDFLIRFNRSGISS